MLPNMMLNSDRIPQAEQCAVKGEKLSGNVFFLLHFLLIVFTEVDLPCILSYVSFTILFYIIFDLMTSKRTYNNCLLKVE